MSDLKERFAELDTVPYPDLLERVESAVDVLETGPTARKQLRRPVVASASPRHRHAPTVMPPWHRRLLGWVYAAATAAIVLLLVGGGVGLSSFLGEDTQPVVSQPTTPAPVTTMPQASTLPTTTAPATTVPEVVEPRTAALMSYEEMFRRFEERNAREAAELEDIAFSYYRESFVAMQTDLFVWDRNSPYFAGITKGKRAPDLAGSYLEPSESYAGSAGTFSMDDFIGSPTIVMLWQADTRDDWNVDNRGLTSRNVAALQELMATDLGDLQLLSVLLDPSSTVKAQEIMSERGFTFPVLVSAEPRTWGLEADNREGVIEVQPVWFALDKDWRVVGAFHHEYYNAHFLVAEILGEPDIGPIEVPPNPSNVNAFTEEDGLAGDCISSVAFAGNGDVWVGSWCGVARYDGHEWSAYLPGATWETNVYSAPDGSLWVTSQSVIYLVNGAELEPVLTDRPWDGEFASLAVTTDGTIWVSDGDQMNWSYDGAEWRSHPESAPEGMAGILTAAPDGSLWAGNERELRRFDGTEWEIIEHPAGRPVSPTFAPDGTPWLESGDGVLEYGDRSWIHHDLGTSVEGIAFSPDGQLWAISPDDGAYRYDGEAWTRYTTADGLPTNHLTAVGVSPNGAVWLGTLESGMVKFTP